MGRSKGGTETNGKGEIREERGRDKKWRGVPRPVSAAGSASGQVDSHSRGMGVLGEAVASPLPFLAS